MIVGQDSLNEIYLGLSKIFNFAFQNTQTFYPQLTMNVPSSGKSISYKFIEDALGMREWLGNRVIRSLKGKEFTLINKDYESTISVLRNDIEDDQLGVYTPIFNQLGISAAKHPDQLLAALMADGFSTACYDGTYMFNASHPIGDTGSTQSNYSSGASTAWYLFDVSTALRPFVWQTRQAPQLLRQDNAAMHEAAFMRKEYYYGVDYRAVMGYGMWQFIHASKTALTADNYNAAREAMAALVDDDGKPLGIMGNLLVVPPSLEAEAREILQSENVLGDGTAGGSKTNIWRGTAQLLVNPYLS